MDEAGCLLCLWPGSLLSTNPTEKKQGSEATFSGLDGEHSKKTRTKQGDEMMINDDGEMLFVMSVMMISDENGEKVKGKENLHHFYGGSDNL